MAYLTPDLVQKGLSISSSFAKGGPVAAFQEGGGVNDYESEAYGVGSSVSSTAASEDIGTVDEDRGPDDRNDSDDIDFADEFEVPDPDKYDYGPGPDDGGDGDAQRVVPGTVLDGDTPTAAESILASRGLSLPDSPEAERIRAETAAALGVLDRLKETIPEAIEKNKKVTDVPTKQVNFTAPPAGGIGDLGPVSPDELDEIQDFEDMTRPPDELDEIQDFEDMVEAEKAAGASLQQKKGALAGLGVFAGSPALAAGPFARDIFKTLTQPDVKAGELLAGKGLGRNQTAEEVVNEKGERVGVVVSDPTGVMSIQPTSISNSFDPALRDAYSKLNERDSEERERGSGDDRELITEEDVAVEEVEAAPKKPPTIDIIPFRPEDFYYLTQQQRQGLPSMMNMRRS